LPASSRPPGRDTRRALGARGEEAVARWYQDEGFEILDRNWRRRDGELDLVVGRDRVVVFCEVKTRSGDRFGAPVEAITHEKRRRLRLLAARWLDESGAVVREVRFDIASVMARPGQDLEIEVLQGAF